MNSAASAFSLTGPEPLEHAALVSQRCPSGDRRADSHPARPRRGIPAGVTFRALCRRFLDVTWRSTDVMSRLRLGLGCRASCEILSRATVAGDRDLPSDNHQAGHGWLRQRVIGLPVAIPPVRFRTLIPYGRELCRPLGRVRADPPVLGSWLDHAIEAIGRGSTRSASCDRSSRLWGQPTRRRDVGTGQVAVRGSDQAVKAIRVRLAAMAIPSTQVRAGAASMTAVTAVASRTRMTGLAAAVNLVRR